jgi:hypothetical protein
LFCGATYCTTLQRVSRGCSTLGLGAGAPNRS